MLKRLPDLDLALEAVEEHRIRLGHRLRNLDRDPLAGAPVHASEHGGHGRNGHFFFKQIMIKLISWLEWCHSNPAR